MKKTILIAIALAAALCCSTAGAVDMTTPITQFDGKPLTDTQTGLPTKMMVGQAIENSLLATEPSTPPTEKGKRYWLALKVHEKTEKGEDIDFSPEEIVMIKDLVNRYQTILISGQVIRALDPTSVPK